MSGFGLSGPDADLPGYDLIAQARSGLMSVAGERDGSPQRVSTALSDVVAGMCAALAISAAVVRQRTHELGDVIDVSLLDVDLALMAPRIAAYQAGEAEPQPSGGTDSVLAVYQSFQASDRTIAVAIGNDAMWVRFCLAIDLPDLAADPALRDNEGRRAHRSRVADAVAARLATRTAAEWLDLFRAATVPASVVQSLSEVVADPQVVARGSLMPMPGSVGSLVSVRGPFRFLSQPEPRNERFPDLGAHTHDVLIEAGYDSEEIEALSDAGALGAFESVIPRSGGAL